MLAHAAQRRQTPLSQLCAIASFGTGIWALTHAPVTRQLTPGCGASLGAQTFVHRSLSPVWVLAVLLGVLALVLPAPKRRSFLAVGLVGLTIGLAIAALFRVGSWTTGLCVA